MENDVTIVFCTCDKYYDLWNDFFRLLKKYWPEFHGTIILNSESKEITMPGLSISKPLNCSSDLSWEDRLALSLKKVKTEFVLIMLDDFFLKRKVHTEEFEKSLEIMKKTPAVVSITYLREPGVTQKRYKNNYYIRRRIAPYKMTAHITLYRKDYLLNILRKNESAWEFETNGTVRSWFLKGVFLGPINNFNPVFSYDFGSLVIRGKFYKPVKSYFEENEECHFTTSRSTIAQWGGKKGDVKSKRKVLKIIKYVLKGLISLFKRKPC